MRYEAFLKKQVTFKAVSYELQLIKIQNPALSILSVINIIGATYAFKADHTFCWFGSLQQGIWWLDWKVPAVPGGTRLGQVSSASQIK